MVNCLEDGGRKLGRIVGREVGSISPRLFSLPRDDLLSIKVVRSSSSYGQSKMGILYNKNYTSHYVYRILRNLPLPL